jgi:hypothetical protein
MDRRQFLTVCAAATGAVLLAGHSPYRQWQVYRQTHLVIFTSRDDPGADDLGEALAALIRTALPDSKAAVARGPRVERIASLMSTGQAEVAVVSHGNARAMFRGEAPFQVYGAIALRVLVQNGAYKLVCREDFLPQHGYLVAEALMENGRDLGLSIPGRATNTGDVPPHVGAVSFAEGRPPDLRDRQ